MHLLKPLISVQHELQILPKFYRSHVWITPPAQDGLSFLGISDYAKQHFVRIHKLDYETFPKTAYSLTNRYIIDHFVQESQQKKEKGQLTMSEQIEWGRFHYVQGQAFVTMETLQFDVQLQAPVDMRVVEQEYNCFYFRRMLTAPYYFRVKATQPQQISLLDSEQKYLKSRKMIF